MDGCKKVKALNRLHGMVWSIHAGLLRGEYLAKARAFGRIQMEARRPHPEACSCGNIFKDDSVYCRKCGKRRPALQASASFPSWPRTASELRASSPGTG